MSAKGPGKIAAITSTVNAQLYTEILDTRLIPSNESMYGDEEIIFQDDNASCHGAKDIKSFLQERHINSMIWAANRAEFVQSK